MSLENVRVGQAPRESTFHGTAIVYPIMPSSNVEVRTTDHDRCSQLYSLTLLPTTHLQYN